MSESTQDILGEGELDDGKEAFDPERPLVIDEGVFLHDTGDKYDGTFEAKKKDRTARMQGLGTYTTAEGDVYTGFWDNDRLGISGEVSITYTEGSRYEGMLKDWNYSGLGRYTYPDDSTIICEFSESCPSGNLTLLDPNGHIWLGRAESGFVWFDPVNHYYHMLEKSRESRILREPKVAASVPAAASKSAPTKAGKRK